MQLLMGVGTEGASKGVGRAGTRGLYIVCGFSGMGFKISPATGLVVSELVLDGRGKTVDISAFDPERFAKGAPIKAEWEYGDEEPAAYT